MLSSIYKFISPQISLNYEFFHKVRSIVFEEVHENYDIVIEEWLREESKGFKLKGKKDYPIVIFKKLVRFLIKILRRLYGELDHEHGKIKWIAIIHSILNEGKFLNSIDLLSQNITDLVKLLVSSPPEFNYIFCMYAYLLDVVIALVTFPLMNWNYPSDEEIPIQNYAPILWESNFKYHFYDIFHYVLIHSHKILFGTIPPRK